METLIRCIFITIWSLGYMAVIWFVFRKYVSKRVDRWLDIKNKQAQTSEYDLFLNFDTEVAHNQINDLVDDYIATYVLYNFTINDKEYIGQEDAEKMIKEVTRTIVINLSDLYLFYFKMFRSIKNDEDLVLAVRDVVKERSLTYITEANKPTQ